MKFRKYNIDFNKEVFWKIFKFTLIGIIPIFFIGLLISFIFANLMLSNYLSEFIEWMNPRPERIAAKRRELGLDLPIVLQYFRYLADLFTGNWGDSVSVATGTTVWDLLARRLPRTIDLLLLPTSLGLIFGLLLGRIANDNRGKWKGKLIYTLAGLGSAIPIFIFGMIMQLNYGYLIQVFPTVGYKQVQYADPPYVTGFFLIDALISREYHLIVDYLWHLTMPVFVLSILSVSLFTWLTSHNARKSTREKSLISNTTMTVILFGFILLFNILVETTFGIYGIGLTLVDAVGLRDYPVLNGLVYIITIVVVIISFISNFIFTLLKSSTFIQEDSFEIENNKMDQVAFDGGEIEVKNYDRKRPIHLFKSPFTVIGLIIIGTLIIMSIFAQEISGYSIVEANGVYINPFSAPSSEHLLGTTQLGRDVFARILYGIRFELIFGLIVNIIGLIFGSALGILSSLHRFANMAIGIGLIGLIILPFPIFILLFMGVFGRELFVPIIIMGILLIPIYTRMIAYVPFHRRNTKIFLQKLVIYFPLIYGSVILIYSALGFLGFADPTIIQLGTEINHARDMLYSAPWASLWPGFFLFLLVAGFFLLFMGVYTTFMDQLDSLRISEENNLIMR